MTFFKHRYMHKIMFFISVLFSRVCVQWCFMEASSFCLFFNHMRSIKCHHFKLWHLIKSHLIAIFDLEVWNFVKFFNSYIHQCNEYHYIEVRINNNHDKCHLLVFLWYYYVLKICHLISFQIFINPKSEMSPNLSCFIYNTPQTIKI